MCLRCFFLYSLAHTFFLVALLLHFTFCVFPASVTAILDIAPVRGEGRAAVFANALSTPLLRRLLTVKLRAAIRAAIHRA